jgi:hypothetical protein
MLPTVACLAEWLPAPPREARLAARLLLYGVPRHASAGSIPAVLAAAAAAAAAAALASCHFALPHTVIAGRASLL